MPDFGSLGAGIFSNEAFNSGTSQPITITASASANTKGSYTELVAATDYAASWLYVTLITSGSFATRSLTDIAIGGAGSEQVIIANLPRVFFYLHNLGAYSAIFPLSIPAGTRISARMQASTGSHTQLVQVATISASMPGPPALGVATSYGMDTSDSGLTSIDPGTTANTKGSYTELTASTSYPINWLTIFFGEYASRTVAQYWLVDIAVGAASSEQVIVSNLAVSSDNTNDAPAPTCVQIPVQTIPAGTRISARCQCSVNTATARLLDVGIIGA